MAAIVEVKSRSWDDKPVKHKKRAVPKPIDPESPKLFPLAVFIAPRGSGKTYTCTKLIQHYLLTGLEHETLKGHMQDQRVIIFSPTYEANPVLHVLGAEPQDVVADFSREALLAKEADIYDRADEWELYLERREIWDNFKRSGYDETKLKYHDLMELTAMGFKPPIRPKTYRPNTFGPSVVHCVFDDLAGLKAFSSQNSVLVNMCIRNRHKRICVYILSQSGNQIPKIVRNNCSLLLLWKFSNIQMVLDDLADLCGSALLPEEFMALYNHCVKEKHTPFFLDLSDSESPIFRKGLGTYISLQHKQDPAQVTEAPSKAPPEPPKK